MRWVVIAKPSSIPASHEERLVNNNQRNAESTARLRAYTSAIVAWLHINGENAKVNPVAIAATQVYFLVGSKSNAVAVEKKMAMAIAMAERRLNRKLILPNGNKLNALPINI